MIAVIPNPFIPTILRMRYAVDDRQISYFREHQYLELEGVLSEEMVGLINSQIDLQLERRIQNPGFDGYTPEQQIKAGRDLWRDASAIRKRLLTRDLVQIVSALSDCRLIRLGCDQLLPAGMVVSEPLTLNQQLCFQGLCAGMLVCLESGNGSNPLPKDEGSVAIISPDYPLNLSQLAHGSGRYLLIAFLKERAHYIEQPRDPNANYLKSLGYALGDRVNEQTHPLICRG